MQTVTLASMDILCIINVSFKFDRMYKLTDVFIFQDMHPSFMSIIWIFLLR